MSNHALEINYGTYINMIQSVTGHKYISQYCSCCFRLKTIFFSFDVATKDTATFGYTGGHLQVAKTWNSFYHPMQGTYNYARELEIRAQIGSHMIPIYPIRSASETFYQLKKALGIHSSPFHSVSISAEQYINNHFIIRIRL
jgi:hypothetical protein